MKALKDAKAAHPDAAYWIKADACDVAPGVQESVRHKWAGDVDLNNFRLRGRFIWLFLRSANDWVSAKGANAKKSLMTVAI